MSNRSAVKVTCLLIGAVRTLTVTVAVPSGHLKMAESQCLGGVMPMYLRPVSACTSVRPSMFNQGKD